jgi:hypothetical protein
MNQSQKIRQNTKTTAGNPVILHIVLLLCLVASSCSPGNPILGRWDPQSTKDILSPVPVEFTEDAMIYYHVNEPPTRIPVEYRIKGNEVGVVPKEGGAFPILCRLTENDRLTCDTPFGKAVYVRRKQ